jgi:hypothetical protein
MLDLNTNLYAQNTDTAAANKVTTITLTDPGANAGSRWSIGGIAWSYDGMASLDTSAGIDVHVLATDTAAQSVASNSATLVLSIDINDDGAGFIIPSEPIKFPPNMAVVFNMGDGGGMQKITILGAKLV